MQTLKEVRLKKKCTLLEIQERTNIHIAELSKYERGMTTPPLEDCKTLEKFFRTKIKWMNNAEKKQANEIIPDLMVLMEHYPSLTVVNFASRWLKANEDVRSRGLKHFMIEQEVEV